MGQEISAHRFSDRDFAEFRRRLDEETVLLGRWFREGHFAKGPLMAGLELEAWLVDRAFRPAALNEAFLARVDSPLVVPELARFNVELNTRPCLLQGGSLRAMESELATLRARCSAAAAELDAHVLWIGILPSLGDRELTLQNMSAMSRYRALNDQILRLRGGRPILLDIEGREHLRSEHRDVMLEAAATSLQIHLQVSQDDACRYTNAAKIVSAPLVAVCANAPYLFAQELWEDTRIPLFEQAVALSGSSPRAERVTFGDGYVTADLFSCFESNRRQYDILLPSISDTPPEQMAHVRLQNGTIWRWNRPLIEIDGAGGRPHLRIEHRVASAPPSVVDAVANAALFYGLVHGLAKDETPMESRLPFAAAKANFYDAARHGLGATVEWPGFGRVGLERLFKDRLLPLAEQGLAGLGIARDDIARYLGAIAGRVQRGQNGAAWQRAFVARHGRDMVALTRAYAERQASGTPVHEWDVE